MVKFLQSSPLNLGSQEELRALYEGGKTDKEKVKKVYAMAVIIDMLANLGYGADGMVASNQIVYDKYVEVLNKFRADHKIEGKAGVVDPAFTAKLVIEYRKKNTPLSVLNEQFYVNVWVNIGRVLAAQNKPNEALKWYEQTLKL